MNDFKFYSPTRFVFGRGVTDRTGEEIAALGWKRALIVYGQGSVVRTGTLDRVKASLDAAGVAHTELGGVRPNPEMASVREGIALAREFDADVIVPVGGGSAMDAAKAIALGAVYDGDAWDFWRKRATPTDRLPLACVVTIPASGSEASNSCVISNDEEHLKCGLNTDLNRPVLAIMDPELTFTLPPYQTAAGVTDMIAHIMERFFSGQPAVPVTDNIACGMIRAVIEAAPRVMENPEDYDARANIMWVGTLAHNGLAGLGMGVPGGRDGDWTCHGLEHELSAFDTTITHGAGLAVIFPAWMRYVWREHPERFLEFGSQVFGIEPVDPEVDDLSDIDEEITPERAVEDAVEATIDELQDFFVSLGMPRTLSEFGMTEDDIEKLMPGLTINRGELFGSFKKLTLDDARAIYRSAL
ncbi:iron-containing alcohol dehydrogenase [Collinsella tanakaei]|uniref:iron-containing alcohol dehydrogenase n=1 Tax=Collinsella tanakaei TaxID=626935 RepID=UPI001F406E50|nr:iron-containing alcohol dehydrogenase [Collinsella tanakaei]MCF2621137.1 iron-containing alcohol dehydrogenase [Collinsella tanakaei]MDM8301458.1 iron-containing alcohol dehydrogenase [Collinsella tanakaei]